MGKDVQVTEAHLEFLDNLRESGVTNMYGAMPYIVAAFPGTTRDEARMILCIWMETFGERHGE